MNKKVYIAGPMSWGNLIEHTRRAVEAGTELLLKGYYPFIPQLSVLWDLMIPKGTITHEMWLEYDKEWVLTSVAVIRLSGKSRGADQEVRWARRHSIPVYATVEEFLDAQTSD